MNKYQPNISNLKFKKFRKQKNYHKFLKIKELNFFFGRYALRAETSGFVEGLQIEACRKSIVRHLERKGKLWIHCWPYKPLTSKGSNVRMGKGKGNISKWVYPVKKGEILFEIDDIPLRKAFFSLKKASFKLSIKTKFIFKK